MKEPFYGHYFSTLTKIITDEVPTLGVSLNTKEGTIDLYVNPQFWEQELNDENYRYGILKHEILHIVFKHVLIGSQFQHKDIANIAMDLVVNQYIDTEYLPGEPVLMENYQDLNLEENKDVGYYYNKLMKARKEKRGHSQRQLSRDLDTAQAGDSAGSHELWGKLNNTQQRIIEATIEHTIADSIERSKNSIGNLPWGLQTYFKKLEEQRKPKVNWRRALRQFATTSQRTFLKNTIKRPSKRYGTTPGIKLRHRNRLLVAIDTSGSVSDKELNVFFGELYHIYRQGAHIMVVECDTEIQNTYLYKGKMPDFVMGRGGTDFDEPIRFANETYLPDAIIYFTDGEAAAPENTPIAPIMWLISKEGIDENQWDFLPGRKVKLD